MGNWWSGEQQRPKVSSKYNVVLPTSCRAWERLYSGDAATWDTVAARYGMDKYAYYCGLHSCEREAVCLRYIKATIKADSQIITLERHRASTIYVPISTCPDIKALMVEGFSLKKVAATQRRELILLVLTQCRDLISQDAFPVIHLGDDLDEEDDPKASARKDSEKHKVFRRLSISKKDNGDKKNCSKKFSSSNVDGKKSQEKSAMTTSTSDRSVSSTEKMKPRCLGVFRAPHKDMTTISCHISPDLSQTAILFYSLSKTTKTFCYTLHCYSNLSLTKENNSENGSVSETKTSPSTPQSSSPFQEEEDMLSQGETSTPHLIQTVKLSREVQPYFVYDPRYGSSRIAVANYESRDANIVHELVVLNLEATMRETEPREAKVVKRGKLSLPALFGNSRFNLLFSKDGELIILQKLTDDRFGVTSFCDIYIFNADDLTLIKYMTAALPGLFHICKVSYEPVFSRCGGFMRILNHRVSNGNGDGDGDDTDDYINVNIYQLPRSLNLMTQCRRVILQHMSSASGALEMLPLPHRLKDYLKFGPVY